MVRCLDPGSLIWGMSAKCFVNGPEVFDELIRVVGPVV